MIQDNPDGININQAVSSSLLRKRLQKVPSSVSVFSENASLLSQVKVAKSRNNFLSSLPSRRSFFVDSLKLEGKLKLPG